MSDPIVRANIEVHTRMADTYNRLEPHFRPENQAKVRRVLEELAARCGGGKLLDLGCGTGFILHLARDLFGELHGVDVTPAMLAQVDRSSGNIVLHETAAESLPFADATFDMVSAYSFLHHLEDIGAVLREAARVLKPGGLLYADLEPNKLFWDAMVRLADVPASDLPPWVATARDSVTVNDERVEHEFGIPKQTFREAEYSKSILGGIDPSTIGELARSCGFSGCEVRLEWFVGQAPIMHGQGFDEAERIGEYLRAVGPLCDHLFKYVRFVLTR